MLNRRDNRGMNIRVRHAEISDAEAITRVYTAPRVCWGTLQLPYASIEQYRKRLAEPTPGVYILVAEVEGQVVGSLGLHVNQHPRTNHSASFGMGVRDDFQGKGIGTALMQTMVDLADKWLNLKRIALEVYVDNEPAIRLYTKFGFEVEGRLRALAFRDGALVDVLAMARLRLP